MRILDRYLLRELFIPFAYCMVGFTIFWITSDLFDKLGDFKRSELQTLDVLEYYFYKWPQMFPVILPITLLLALLYTLTNMSRHHELIAIRAAGVSLLRMSFPYLSVGFLFSLGLLAFNEFFIPGSLDATDDIMSRYQTNQVQFIGKNWESNIGFTNTKENRTWVIQAFNSESGEMIRPHVEWTLEDGTRHQVYADRGWRADGQWIFTNVQEFVYPPQRGAFPIPSRVAGRTMTELKESPEEILIQVKIGKIMSFKQARKAQLSIREIILFKRMHPEDKDKDTLLHGRLAAPWTCLLVVLIALPFGVAGGRRNVAVGVASAIFLVFGYYVFQHLTLALGYGGHLPGWAAGWLPNVIFGAAGIFATFKFR